MSWPNLSSSLLFPFITRSFTHLFHPFGCLAVSRGGTAGACHLVFFPVRHRLLLTDQLNDVSMHRLRKPADPDRGRALSLAGRDRGVRGRRTVSWVEPSK